jgi:PAS domain S-box-containing protein
MVMKAVVLRWSLRLPLARKLTVLAAATTAVSVAIACALLAWYDSATVRNDLREDTETLVDSIAAGNTATLSFDDAREATGTLRVAALNRDIQVAALVKRDGQVLARYDRSPVSQTTPLLLDADAVSTGAARTVMTSDRLVVVRPVKLDAELLGMAYVDLALNDMHGRLYSFRRALAGALLGAVGLAMFIGSRLQKLVSRPLLHLTEVTRAVARDRDYDVRAEQMSEDEVGELTRSVNEMLAHIQQRDAQLESHRHELEQTVSVRTAELQASVERFKLLVESTNAVPWEMHGPTSSFSYISPQAVRLFGHESHSLTGGMGLLDLVHPDDRDHVREKLVALSAESGRGIDLDHRAVTAQGAAIDVRSAISAKRRPDGTAVLCGITVDVTQQKKLEMELRQAQKLESVGRLAAGVAHEINTPVQFVSDSVHFLQGAMSDLGTLIGEYRKLHASVSAGAPDQEAAAQATQIVDDIDLDYLLENMPNAFERSLEGLKRVAVIVRSMKEFAHPDQKEMSAANLNQAIQSTLTIARNEYKYVADVETELAELPLVRCHLGDVNQAILNLIVNAAHAIEDTVKGTTEKGLIRIRTRQTDRAVYIDISDSGGGIPEGIRDRIFDPFFTTKGVGRGTGQGLAIARSVVVEKHHGSLTFASEIGKGTTFTIELPLEDGSSKKAA